MSACAALLLKKSSPELVLPLSMAVIGVVFTLGLALFRPAAELWEKVRDLYGVGEVYLLPMIKCCCAALAAKLTAELCRESSQNAAASAIELLGTLCALGAAMPLIGSMLSVIGEML